MFGEVAATRTPARPVFHGDLLTHKAADAIVLSAPQKHPPFSPETQPSFAHYTPVCTAFSPALQIPSPLSGLCR